MKVRLLKKIDFGEKGDIVNVERKGAMELIDSKYAEYEDKKLQDKWEREAVEIRYLINYGGEGSPKIGEIWKTSSKKARQLVERKYAEYVKKEIAAPPNYDELETNYYLKQQHKEDEYRKKQWAKQEKTPITIPKQLKNARFCFVNGKLPMGEGWQKLENTYAATDPKLQARLKKGDSYGTVGGLNDFMVVDADNDNVYNAFRDHHDTLTGKTGNGIHLYYKVPGLQKSTALQEIDYENTTPDKLILKNVGHITSKGRMAVAPGSLHYKQIAHKKYEPTGKRYEITKDVEIKTITEEEVNNIIKPFTAEYIRSFKNPKEETKEEYANKISIDISLVAKKMQDLQKSDAPKGYRGHNPSHPNSKSRMDLTIDTDKNMWLCSACCNNGYGFGNSLYLIALNEGILQCHECKKGGLRGEDFLKVKKLAIEKYGISPDVFPKKEKKISPVVTTDKYKLLEEYEVLETNKDDDVTGVNALKLAKMLLEADGQHYLVIKDNQQMFNYNGSYYEPLGSGFIKQRVQHYLHDIEGVKSLIHYKKEVVEYIRNHAYIDRERLNPPLNLINVKNGIYDTENDVLLSHTPEHYFLQEIPITYDPTTKIQKIKTFFETVLNLDDIPIIQEFLGDCLIRESRYKKALMCVGQTDTGKSQLLSLIGKFLGEKNVSHVPLDKLCYDRFAPIQLYGKLANIRSELHVGTLKAIDMFLMVTCGDVIGGERKYQDNFDFRSYAKLIFSCNKIPDIKEKNDAYYNRWIVLDCNNQIQKEDQIPNYFSTISTEEELSGLLNYAIEGIKRLMKNKKYSDYRDIEETKAFMEKGSNPILEFATTHVKLDPDSIITKDSLYSAYVGFCQFFSYPTKDSNVFSRQVKKYLPFGYSEGKHNKKRSWEGIKCNFEGQNENEKDTTLKDFATELQQEG